MVEEQNKTEVQENNPVQADKKACTWAMACHLSSFIGFLGLPFFNIVAPLIVWLIKKDEFPFLDEHGKSCLNFQISMTIYSVIAFFLSAILIGVILLPIILVLDVVFVIIAALKASKGEKYSYPLSFKFLK